MRKLLKFSASWCHPCAELAKQLSITQLPYPLESYDTDTVDSEIIKKYNIRSLPTLILLENDEVIWRNTGYISGPRLIEELNKLENVNKK